MFDSRPKRSSRPYSGVISYAGLTFRGTDRNGSAFWRNRKIIELNWTNLQREARHDATGRKLKTKEVQSVYESQRWKALHEDVQPRE